MKDWDYHQINDFFATGSHRYGAADGGCQGLSMLWVLAESVGGQRCDNFFHALSAVRAGQRRVDDFIGSTRQATQRLRSEPFPYMRGGTMVSDVGSMQGRVNYRYAFQGQRQEVIEQWAGDNGLQLFKSSVGFSETGNLETFWRTIARTVVSDECYGLINVLWAVPVGHSMAFAVLPRYGIFRLFDPNVGQYSFLDASAMATFLSSFGPSQYPDNPGRFWYVAKIERGSGRVRR